jgi:hypothetical protein
MDASQPGSQLDAAGSDKKRVRILLLFFYSTALVLLGVDGVFVVEDMANNLRGINSVWLTAIYLVLPLFVTYIGIRIYTELREGGASKKQLVVVMVIIVASLLSYLIIPAILVVSLVGAELRYPMIRDIK